MMESHGAAETRDRSGVDKRRILILGGTTEARDLAGRLGERTDLAVTLSLAGRTLDPAPQPVPVRTGGFGGAEGLASYLGSHAIDLLIDATHPFAKQISANARAASGITGIPLLRLERLTFRFVEAGFVVLTLALVLGFVSAHGWRFDHKTVFSLLGWAVFAALIGGRLLRGWRGRRATRWLYAGTVLLLLGYAGSRFVFEVVLGRPAS